MWNKKNPKIEDNGNNMHLLNGSDTMVSKSICMHTIMNLCVGWLYIYHINSSKSNQSKPLNYQTNLRSKPQASIGKIIISLTLKPQSSECLCGSFQVLLPYFSSSGQPQQLLLPTNHLTNLMQEMLKMKEICSVISPFSGSKFSILYQSCKFHLRGHHGYFYSEWNVYIPDHSGLSYKINKIAGKSGRNQNETENFEISFLKDMIII